MCFSRFRVLLFILFHLVKNCSVFVDCCVVVLILICSDIDTASSFHVFQVGFTPSKRMARMATSQQNLSKTV